MKIKNQAMLGIVCLALVGCAAPPTVPNPQTVVYHATPAKVKNAIARACDESQYQIEQQTDSSVVCTRVGGTGAQIAYGYKYGSDVQAKYQFNWYSMDDGGIKISGNTFFESQNAYGMMNRSTNPSLNSGAQYILNNVKYRLDGKK